MVDPEIIEKIKMFRLALEDRKIRIAKIILYGSQISGIAHKDSDIDVAVISPDFGKDRFEEGARLFQIAYKIDPRIEPVPISSTSFQVDTWIPLIYAIRTQGIEIN
jgi:predicted nucleotidyltransferase